MDIKNHATLPSGLISYWRLDGDANDSKDSHNGSIINATVNPAGKIGSAYNFNGTSMCINFGTHADFEMAQLSISIWTWHYGNINRCCIAKKNNTVTQWSFGTPGVATPRFECKVGGTVYAISDTAYISGWHHWVLTFDGSYLHLYRDGLEVATPVAASGSIDSSPTMPLLLGCRCANGVLVPGADYWSGVIDEVGIWNRALVADEVLALWAAGGGLPYENLERGISNPKKVIELFSKISLPGVVGPEQAPNSIAIGAADIFEVPEGFKCCGPLIPEVAPTSLNQGVANTLKVRRRG